MTGLRRTIGRRRRWVVLAIVLAWTGPALAADYTMRSGDTLYDLAQQRYGDSSYWRALKWFNGIQNVYAIPVGTPINFPDKASLDKINQILDDPSTTAADKARLVGQATGGGAGGASASGAGGAPGASVNAGTGKPINYNAIDALRARRVPTY